MAVLCAQAASIGEMPKWHRWLVFLVGIFETMIWSGTVFGWASLVHVLKTMGVYSHLCKESLQQVYSLSNNATQKVDGAMLVLTDSTQLACSSQDQQFALIYTVACVLYSIPGILLGYCLHHFGLAVTRVLGGLLISSGFILLSFTTADSPSYLWGAAIFLSIGGNIIRMAGLQLGNLFPERRNTAIAIISGMFTPSAGMFIILQYAREAGLPWVYICSGFAAVASLILLLTPLMPRHHVPYTDEVETQDEVKDEKVILKPVRESIFSWSNLFHTYWVFSNMFCVVLFSTYFNSLIVKFGVHIKGETSKILKWKNTMFTAQKVYWRFCIVSEYNGMPVTMFLSRLVTEISDAREKLQCICLTSAEYQLVRSYLHGLGREKHNPDIDEYCKYSTYLTFAWIGFQGRLESYRSYRKLTVARLLL
ncbi:equilibrative nucleobase transporter 1-like [Penaeus indicus]|uniref:equilibrative nucleobase transporter 1-like n=1 Tax=Penaeus indicus TaxID=29960 RepID=UPI00300D13C9